MIRGGAFGCCVSSTTKVYGDPAALCCCLVPLSFCCITENKFPQSNAAKEKITLEYVVQLNMAQLFSISFLFNPYRI